jgi:histidyl-tRNA synthetase
MAELRRPPGTFDVLPPDSGSWQVVLSAFARVASSAGYGLVLTPTFEDLGVFQRIGESTDVVRKEMYDFVDKGNRHVALRPELTASIVRAFIEHRPVTPWKIWTAGSNFRFERPQAGRYREFHQLDLEAFGSPDPDIDAELIALGWEYFQALGIRRVELLVNSLGDANCRPAYRELLLGYLRDRRDELCPEHQARLEENPLRVLDCKKPECRSVVSGAPRQIDHLCDDCAAHFGRVTEGLGALSIPFTVEPLLVRGLDYYTRTAFEYTGAALESAQNALGGGGRYDGLVAAMGGPDTPAVGFALGIERILLALEAEGVEVPQPAPLDAFVVDFAGGSAARDLTARLREAGFRVDRSFDGRSAKAQFKAADRSGARFALVVGPDEAAAGTVGVKDLLGGGEQATVPQEKIIDEMARRIGSAPP